MRWGDLNGLTDMLQTLAIFGLTMAHFLTTRTTWHMRRVLLAAKDAEIARLLDDNRALRAQLERARKP